MTIPDDDPRLDVLRSGPPMICYRANNGSTVTEPLAYVGTIRAPLAARYQLEQYAVSMLYARFDSKSSRWEGCLLSGSALQMLLELHAEGQFPFAIEAVPSQAEAEWQVARATGATERAPKPLRAFVTPASLDVLGKLTVPSGVPSWKGGPM